MTSVGTRVLRKEDPALLRGLGRFGDDQSRAGQLWARIVRSPLAHGRIRSVDTAAASASPGVVRVVTAQDLPTGLVIPVRLSVQGLDLSPFLQPVLAGEAVRYVGEPVAVVLAEDAYAAEDAAELVVVDVEDLPAVLDADAALAPGAVPLHAGGNCAADFTVGFGNVADAFRAAAHVVDIDFRVGRHSAVPLEPRSLLVDVDPRDGSLDIYGMTKVPVFNRGVLAGMLGIDETSIHIHAVDAGGGFGVRGEFYPEDYLLPWLAHSLRRPVKWAEDRVEHLVAVNHSRQQRHRLEVALAADGTILAMRDEAVQDNGAYCRTHGVIVPELTMTMLPGPYRVPAYEGRVRVALTNKTPCGTYRAPGRFEGTTVREHLFDVAADRLGMDRVDFRRRNLLRPDELPHARSMNTLGEDIVLDAADYPGLLDKAVAEGERLGYHSLVEQNRAAGRFTGIGLALFVEKSGLGPQETADVSVSATGMVHVHTGGTSLGQGIETVMGQIAADALTVGPDQVRVVNGDTTLQPYGMGSWASRSTVVGGSAVHLATVAVRDRAREIASRMLEVSVDDLEVADGIVRVLGDSGTSLTLGEIARACLPGGAHLGRDEPAGLTASRRFEVGHMTYPYGVHLAVVDVDAGTGKVSVLRYLVAYEIGRAINPTLVEGQLMGGVAQGVGGALLEEFRYDDAGQPQSVTFMDYMLPTAAEVPVIDLLVVEDFPAPGNPLGARGAGEGGLTAAGGALANAVRDALSTQHALPQLPITPDDVLAAWSRVHDGCSPS